MNISPPIGELSTAGRGTAKSPLNSPLINYTLSGLQRCWLPEHGRWSHIYHLDGRDPPNELLPQSDVFYTLNVLLGMSRVDEVPANIDVSAIFPGTYFNWRDFRSRNMHTAWRYGLQRSSNWRFQRRSARDLSALLSEKKNWQAFRAQDIGMLLTGIVAQAKAGRREWLRFADPLFEFLIERYHSELGLFFNAPLRISAQICFVCHPDLFDHRLLRLRRADRQRFRNCHGEHVYA